MANFHRITSAGDYYTNAAVLDEIALTPYSVQFNGTNQYLQTAITAVTGTFTIEFWVYNQSFGGVDGKGYLFNGTTSSNANRVQIGIGSTGQLFYYHENASAGTFTVNAGSTLFSLNTWYHVAVVSNGTTLTLYINGVSVGSGTITNTPSPGTAFYIGFLRSSGALQYHQGYISNFRYTTSVVYSAAFTAPNPPLANITNTILLTCQSSTIIDNGTANGGSGYSISNPNAATVSSSVFPIYPSVRFYNDGSFYTTLFDEVSLGVPYSVQFNGTNQYLLASGSQTPGLTSENFTIECWFNLSGLTFAYPGGSYGACILNAATTAVNGGVWLFIAGSLNTPTSINLTSSGSTVGPQASAGGLTIALNVWHHLAVSRSGSNMAIWLDGKKLTITSSLPTSSYAALPLNIGYTAHSASYAMYTNGYISNLRIVKGTPVYDPTGGDIIQPAAPLTAVTGTYLLTCQSATVIDNGSGFTMSNPNGATVSSSVVPPAATKRAYSNGMLQISGQFDDYTTITQTYSGAFNGSSSYLTIASNPLLDTWGTTGYATLEYWFYVSSPNSIGHHFNMGPDVTNRVWIIQTTTALNFGTTQGNVSTTRLTSSVYPALNAWHHIALVRQGTTVTIWLDGVNVASGAPSLYSNAAGVPIYIGVQAFSPLAGDWFRGSISNFRIVKGTTSAAALYTQPFTPTVSPLYPIAGTSLLTLQNATIIDNSGNGISITNNSSAVTISNTLVPF
jgi:hypothetical protein